MDVGVPANLVERPDEEELEGSQFSLHVLLAELKELYHMINADM